MKCITQYKKVYFFIASLMLTERLVVVEGRGREGRGRSEFVYFYLNLYLDKWTLSGHLY